MALDFGGCAFLGGTITTSSLTAYSSASPLGLLTIATRVTVDCRVKGLTTFEVIVVVSKFLRWFSVLCIDLENHARRRVEY
jgi:hypothetical protein